MKANLDTIKKYIAGNKRHASYKEAVDVANHMKFHFDEYDHEKPNPYFFKLIDIRRPSESDTIREYRRLIYITKTKRPLSKVINSLKKIVRSPDWNISWAEAEENLPSKIREDETLRFYTEKKFPFFKSFENWLYTIVVKAIMKDPNGAFVTMPVDFNVRKEDYVEPYPFFVSSKDIYSYKENDHIIFKSQDTKDLNDREGKLWAVPVFYVINKEGIFQVYQVNNKGDYKIDKVYAYNFKVFPVVKAGGIPKEIKDRNILYDSFLSDMLPDLDTAAREVSDLDAEVVQHVFSTMWYYAGTDCSHCNGTGKVLKDGKQSQCPKCNGEGIFPKSPYKDLVMRAPGVGEQNAPIPPGGYIEKDTKIVELQDKRIDNHIYNALSSVNMEFLSNTPLNESGRAKEVDKDELDNFVYGIAYWLVESITSPILEHMAYYRYFDLLNGDVKAIDNMLPDVPIPERYMILTDNFIAEEVKKAKDAGIDPVVINQIEIEYVEKKFQSRKQEKDKIITSKLLNPFPGKTIAELLDMKLAGVGEEKDIIMSVYLPYFIERAIQENKDFLKMDRDKQKEIIMSFVDEKTPSKGNDIINQIDANATATNQ